MKKRILISSTLLVLSLTNCKFFSGNIQNTDIIEEQIIYEVKDDYAIVSQIPQSKRKVVIDSHVEINGIEYEVKEIKGKEDDNFISSYDAEEVVLPSTLKRIGARSFEGFKKLKEIIIPDSVEHIGIGAFSYCTNLEKIVTPAFGEIPEDALLNKALYTDLYDFYLDDKGHYYGYLEMLKAGNCFSLPVMFNDSDNLPFDYGGGYFHYYSYDLKSYPANLKEIIFSSGKALAPHALSYATKLSSITLPSSIEYIFTNAFERNDNLNVVNIPSLKDWLEIKFDGKSANPLSYARNLYINNELVENIEINEGIEAIYPYSFFNIGNINSISLPSTIEYLSNNAFSSFGYIKPNYYKNGCYIGNENNPYLYLLSIVKNNVSSFEIHEDTKFINDSLFKDNPCIEKVILNSNLLTIPNYTFSNCLNLKQVIIPDDSKLEEIGYYAFANCNLLTNINLADSITKIYDYAFFSTSISLINLSKELTYLGENAFAETNIDKITIPENVDYIGSYCFFNTSIEWISLPKNIDYVGYGILSNCENTTNEIKVFILEESLPAEWDEDWIGHTVMEIKYYPNTYYDDSIAYQLIDNELRVVQIDSITSNARIKQEVAGFITTSIGNDLMIQNQVNNIIIPKTINFIDETAFNSSLNLYFEGSINELQFDIINIENKIYYYSETKPTNTNYDYWYYDNNYNIVNW